MTDDAMTRAKALMTQAANAILAGDPDAPRLAEHALAQLNRAQLEQDATDAGLSEADILRIKNTAALSAWGYDTRPALKVVE